ncbi:hypothetical protein LCGC14_2775090, partial [marine sediment metagenome]
AIENLWEISNCKFAYGHGNRGKYPVPSEPGNAYLCGYLIPNPFNYIKFEL